MAKEELSDTLRTVIEIQCDGVFYELEATRDEFERATKPLLDKTLEATKRLVERNGLFNADRLHAVMVGGGAHMPCAKAGLSQLLGEKTRVHLHRPDKAIAFGAARFAENDGIVLQLAPFSYGIGVFIDGRDEILNLIFGKAELPTQTGEHKFATCRDNMTEQRIRVYQNASANKRVNINEGVKTMDVTVRFLRPMPKGTPVNVEMSLNSDGTLAVKAIDPSTNRFAVDSVNIIMNEN
jgi:molecular chaperone DnaK (HSP70)